MTTITITEQPDSGGLRLAVNTKETITAITRSDANGVAQVRTLPGLLPWTSPIGVVKRNSVTNGWPTSVAGWGTSGGYVQSYVSGSLYGRSKYMLYTKSGGGSYVTYGRRAGLSGSGSSTTSPTTPGEVVAVTPGQNVFVSLDVGTDTPNTVARATIRFFDASYASVGTAAGEQVDTQVNTWQTITAEGQAPAGAASYWLEWAVQLKSGDTVGGEKSWASRCLLSGMPGAYFDGGSADTDVYDFTYEPGGLSVAMGATQDLILTDYEAASGDVMYTAGAATTASISWALPDPWLFVPVMPAYSVRLKSLLEYSAGGESLGTVHELLGREDPVAVLRGMSTRRGTLRLYCGTFAEAITVVEATRRGEVLMLRQPEHRGLDMYFTATSYGIPTLTTDGGASVFGVDISYVQLARPSGDLSGSLGWTFAALAAAYPTFSALPGAFETFQDVLLNEAK